MMHKHIALTGLLLVGLLAPTTMHAYLLPEDVLFSDKIDDYMPPQPRSSQVNVRSQQLISERRRNAEQEAIFAEQRPPEPVVEQVEEPMHAAAPEAPADTVAQRTNMRLLERIQERQDVLYLESELRRLGLHSGAPSGRPLAPTGPGTVAAIVTMFGAMGWTLKRASNGKVVVKK